MSVVPALPSHSVAPAVDRRHDVTDRTGRRLADALPIGAFLVLVAAAVLSAPLGEAIQPVFLIGMLVITLGVPVVVWLQRGGDLAFFLLIPTAMSAWQNVYLLPAADDLTAAQLRSILPLNFGYALMLAVAASLLGPGSLLRAHADLVRERLLRTMTWCAAVLTGYGVMTLGVFGGTLAAALGSWRNLASPFLFLLVGLLAARSTRATSYARYLVVLGVAALTFGFVEFTADGFWQDVGLASLWQKKGIGVALSTGLPENFFSSENIGDTVARRMAGPFADPVNFGTFLLVAFLAAWWTRSRLVAAAFLLGAWLVVSKGALLGVLVWVVAWARYRLPAPLFWLTTAAAGAAGVGFYRYTLVESSGSTTAHVDGFTAAFEELPHHPLGRGLGRVGVIAGVLGGGGTDSDVTESGIGAVIAQLGVVGLGVYVTFFVLLVRAGLRLADPRERVLVVSLVVGFALNAMFNEIAMSPNSSAPYFVLLGLVLGGGGRGTSGIVAPVLCGRDLVVRGRPRSRRGLPRSAAAHAQRGPRPWN